MAIAVGVTQGRFESLDRNETQFCLKWTRAQHSTAQPIPNWIAADAPGGCLGCWQRWMWVIGFITRESYFGVQN
jgi:hypothetical protein